MAPQAPGFLRTSSNGLVYWRGSPDSDASQVWLLGHLREVVGGQFLSPYPSLDSRRKGNLGEFTTYTIALTEDFRGCRIFAGNAVTPLKNISGDGLDILCIRFGADPAADTAAILEVKTTTDTQSLDYASRLVDDYQKLFDLDPLLTLQTRLQALKPRLAHEHLHPELCPRLTALGENSPSKCSRIKLHPTLVHDTSAPTPDTKLLAVKSQVEALGWSASSIVPWSIAMDSLADRLLRLARGSV